MATYTLALKDPSNTYAVAAFFAHGAFPGASFTQTKTELGNGHQVVRIELPAYGRAFTVRGQLDERGCCDIFEIDTGLSRDRVQLGLEKVLSLWGKPSVDTADASASRSVDTSQ